MLEAVAASGLASPLAVLKRMGPGRAGHLSCPMEGYTLAVDFPNRDAARDRAFRCYYQSIMLGALAAALCVGTLAENVGYWSGFTLAAIARICAEVMAGVCA